MFNRKSYCSVALILLILLLTTININAAELEIDENLKITQEKLKTLDQVYVEKVIDGDTFHITGKRRVRLLGLDTPEIKNKREIDLDYGNEARKFARQQLEDEVVYLEYDVSQQDKFGRILAYVFLKDGTFFNAKLLASGYAYLLTVPPDVKYVDLFKKLSREAKNNERGLWGKYVEQTKNLPVVPWQQTGEYIEKKAAVTGTVVDTYDSGKAIFLNFDLEYWHTFSAVIFSGDKCKFAVEPAEFYLNKKVKVIGNIELYKGAPEIIINHPVQIKIVN